MVGRPHRVLILAVAPAQLLDIAGPAETLSMAARLGAAEVSGEPLYRVDCHVVGAPGRAATTSGFGFESTVEEAALWAGAAYETLIVAGGEGARERAGELPVQALVRHLAGRAGRVVGVCTGAFVLAAAGLLRGRRVATHWRWCGELARRHPELVVEPEPIYVRDGAVWTSAGITAGMDLTLALVEADHGHALALAVARELVLFLRRPGGQKQFSTVLSAQVGTQVGAGSRLGDLLAWMAENLGRSLTVEELADRAGLSPRQFARVFVEETGCTPARMVERMRVEAARRRLEQARPGLAGVAALCGFATEETLRRAFLRQVGTSPGEYRERFRQRGAGVRGSNGGDDGQEVSL